MHVDYRLTGPLEKLWIRPCTTVFAYLSDLVMCVDEHLWSIGRYITGLFEQELQVGPAGSSSLWLPYQHTPNL